eukprot:5450012-Pyramimonas_sp.AAC.1
MKLLAGISRETIKKEPSRSPRSSGPSRFHGALGYPAKTVSAKRRPWEGVDQFAHLYVTSLAHATTYEGCYHLRM